MSLNSNSVRTEGVWFTEPNKVEVREKEISLPGPDQVMVSTLYSAISAGSELLLYRGELPDDISLDNSIESLKKGVAYPLQYGYACVGEVTYIGSQVDRSWEGRKVFCFHPHESYFLAETKDLLLIPDNVAPSDAIFPAKYGNCGEPYPRWKAGYRRASSCFGTGGCGIIVSRTIIRVSSFIFGSD